MAALHWQEDLGYILKIEMSRFADGLDVEGSFRMTSRLSKLEHLGAKK